MERKKNVASVELDWKVTPPWLNSTVGAMKNELWDSFFFSFWGKVFNPETSSWSSTYSWTMLGSSCGLNSSLENSLKLRDKFEKFVRILVVTILISFLNLWIFHQSLKVNHHFREISLPPIHVRTQSTLKWKFLFVNSSAWHLIFRCLSLQGPASPLFSTPLRFTPPRTVEEENQYPITPSIDKETKLATLGQLFFCGALALDLVR